MFDHPHNTQLNANVRRNPRVQFLPSPHALPSAPGSAERSTERGPPSWLGPTSRPPHGTTRGVPPHPHNTPPTPSPVSLHQVFSLLFGLPFNRPHSPPLPPAPPSRAPTRSRPPSPALPPQPLTARLPRTPPPRQHGAGVGGRAGPAMPAGAVSAGREGAGVDSARGGREGVRVGGSCAGGGPQEPR